MSSNGKFAGKARLNRRDLSWLFGKKTRRPDKESWDLYEFVCNVMAGHGWRMRGFWEFTEFCKSFGFGSNTPSIWRKWYAQFQAQPQDGEQCFPVCEKRGDAIVWTWFKNSMRIAEWVPIQEDCPITMKLVPFKNGYFKAVPISEEEEDQEMSTEPELQWDPDAPDEGTCFQAYLPTDNFQLTVAKLLTLSGQTVPEHGMLDKSTFDLMGTWRGQPFSLYDYKYDGEIHIGGSKELDVPGLSEALFAGLNGVEGTPYKAVYHNFE
jgi:hypothetical protein